MSQILLYNSYNSITHEYEEDNDEMSRNEKLKIPSHNSLKLKKIKKNEDNLNHNEVVSSRSNN